MDQSAAADRVDEQGVTYVSTPMGRSPAPAIADEIGAPTVDEVATPIDAVPEGASITAFRSGAGGWS